MNAAARLMLLLLAAATDVIPLTSLVSGGPFVSTQLTPTGITPR